MDIGEFFATNVTDGALLFAMLLALIAVIVSFLSPCILPLVPGYLGYVSGLDDPNEPGNRRRVLTGVGLFILGFAAVFTLYGAAFGLIGSWLLRWQDLLMRVLGLLVIVMGLVLLGSFSWLQQSRKISLTRRTGLGGAPVSGVVFGLGWTPWMGPTLSAVLALSISTGNAGRGALLALVYCLGLGMPETGHPLCPRSTGTGLGHSCPGPGAPAHPRGQHRRGSHADRSGPDDGHRPVDEVELSIAKPRRHLHHSRLNDHQQRISS